MTIGKTIKLCRIQKGLNQTNLAELADISVSYLSLLERDKRDPNLSTITRIAKALDVPLFALVAFGDDKLAQVNSELAEKIALILVS